MLEAGSNTPTHAVADFLAAALHAGAEKVAVARVSTLAALKAMLVIQMQCVAHLLAETTALGEGA